MNFLIFRDFSIIFPKFFELYGFILNIFRFKSIKKSLLKFRVDLGIDVPKRITCLHVVTYAHTTWRKCVFIYVHLIYGLSIF